MGGFLDVKRLRYFKAIADHGSLSAAARALNVAQPALSHHVAELELNIGARLLVRRHDGVELTEAGRLLLRHAVDICARVEVAEMELARLAGHHGSKVKIRLAVISSLAADLTPILVDAFSRSVPEVILRITEAGTQDSRELLSKGEADLAVYLVAERDESEIPLAMEQLYLVTAGDHTVPAEPIAFAEAASRRLIMPASGNPLRAFVENAAAQAGLTLNVALEVDGPAPRRNAILAGLGSTIFGAHSVHGAERRIGIVARPIVQPTLYRPIIFGVRKGLDATLVTRIRDVLAQAFSTFGGMEVSRFDEPDLPTS
jgi:LysR family nitrogen assimilation transcriptional regulator